VEVLIHYPFVPSCKIDLVENSRVAAEPTGVAAHRPQVPASSGIPKGEKSGTGGRHCPHQKQAHTNWQGEGNRKHKGPFLWQGTGRAELSRNDALKSFYYSTSEETRQKIIPALLVGTPPDFCPQAPVSWLRFTS
jgi:hypothetical protein